MDGSAIERAASLALSLHDRLETALKCQARHWPHVGAKATVPSVLFCVGRIVAASPDEEIEAWIAAQRRRVR